ncbi:MAG: hypothetical protein JWR08_1182 [Enterovirga sp.]|nr:hypothetical protein [Enterovirga sp.]
MGQAALKISEMDDGAGLPAGSLAPPAVSRPAAVVVPFKSELSAVLGTISRASSALGAHKDRADLFEKRAADAEAQLKAAHRRLAELEIKLHAALDDAKAEKARSADMQARSADMVERTRAMLAQAGERLRAAESRAERAEAGFSTVRAAIEQQLGTQVK